MDQTKIGNFIASKRKEQNMIQEDLANVLGVSNKSVSKWECGKCMPEISIQLPLCEQLQITLNELLAGEACSKETTITQLSDRNLLELLYAYNKLKSQKDVMIGILLIVVGKLIPYDNLKDVDTPAIDFLYGVSIGLSIGMTMIGVVWLIYGITKNLGQSKVDKEGVE